jgi:hypothetical protein
MNLLERQWSEYPERHVDKRNLIAHVLTVPLFMSGTISVLAAPLIGPWLFVGALLMVGSMAVQGRTHRLEPTPPSPFRGPLDVVGRILFEQWWTFPRYVISGGFLRAWRSAK